MFNLRMYMYIDIYTHKYIYIDVLIFFIYGSSQLPLEDGPGASPRQRRWPETFLPHVGCGIGSSTWRGDTPPLAESGSFEKQGVLFWVLI